MQGGGLVLVAHRGHGVDLEGDVWFGGGEGCVHHLGLHDCEGGFACADVEGYGERLFAFCFCGGLSGVGGGVKRGAGGG